MPSLRDKLRAISAQPRQQPIRPQRDDCMVRETVTPLSEFALDERLTGKALSFMTGKDMPDCSRRDICFLDTETTGLSHGAGTVAFLTGIGFFTDDAFIGRQYLMRDYDEETYLLSHVAEHMKACRVLCSFNGVTFDLPLLETRFTMQRMRSAWTERPHIDLLPISRRVWKLRLKKCNLTSLEAAVLGEEREDDLPGSLVPERYFSFLKTGDERLLSDILEHNAQDIISLPRILDRLCRLHEQPLLAREAEDVYSLGRVYEMRGNREGARMCYRAADRGSVSLLARGRIAATLRRDGDWESASRVYTQMVSDRQGGVETLIALAKICEHQKKDIPSAVDYTRRAIMLAADRPGSDMAALQKRYQRLMMKARKE